MIVVSTWANIPVQARSVQQWEADQKIPGYLDDTRTPFLIADQNKTVHAFASQWVDGRIGRIVAVVYRKWTLTGSWTRPIDILLSPTGYNAEIVGAFLDSNGIMHVLFFGGEKTLYYSNAQVSDASDASAWSLPVEVGEGAIDPSSGVIVGDNRGNLVILYNGNIDGKGVYTVKSTDAGYSWSESTPIFLTPDDQLLPFFIKGFMGQSGKLHVVWNNLNLASATVSLYYDRLDVKSDQWKGPVLLEEKPEIDGFSGPAAPFIVDNGKYVVIMYNGGNPYTGQRVPLGRPTIRVRISADNGESWEEATNPFPLLTGSSGEHSLVIDSNQNIHAIANMRIEESDNGQYRAIGGVWYSELRNKIWSNPERFVTSVSAHTLRAVVSQGNVILATWISDPVGEGVWYSYTVLDSPELPIVALPIRSEQSLLTPTSSVPLPVATATQENNPLLTDHGAVVYSPARPLIVAVIPVILLLLVTIIAVQLRDRHKN